MKKEQQNSKVTSSNVTVIPLEKRLDIALDYYKGGMTMRSLSVKYGASVSTIFRSIRTFTGENPEQVEMMKQRQLSNEDELSRLRRENRALKAKLAYEEMRSTAYGTMIDVAEEQFKISIRKKAGTKQ